MKSANEGYFDVIKLAKELRGERLFIQSEIQHIRQLNEKLNRSVEELAQAAWTNTQQRFNVMQLVAQGDLSTQTCCKKVDYISSPLFVDARKVLKYQDTLVLSSIIQYLRSCPAVASLWLAAAEMERPSVGGAVARALCGGLHVCNITPLRKVLQYLAQYHLSNIEDPQRAISEGTSSYTRLYCELLDGFKPARMFLAAALREPILPLLQINHCLIVDTDIIIERMKKSSQPNIDNNDIQEQIHEYRNRVITELVRVTERFINALCNIWKCFPPTIAWIVQQTVLALRTNKRISECDIFYICTNLVFTNFICRAIVNPEIYGITDMDINNLTRLNLIQVSITIEKLCLMKYREVNGKFRDLFSKFEKDSVYPLIDMLLVNTNCSDSMSNDLYSNKFENDDMEEMTRNEVEVEDKRLLKTEPFVDSNIVLFTPNDLQLLVDLFKKISLAITEGSVASHEQLDCDVSNSTLEKNDALSNTDKVKKNNVANGTNLIDKISEELYNNNDNEVACGISYTNNDALKTGFNTTGNKELCNLLKGLDVEQVSKLQKLLKRLPSSNFNRENSNSHNEQLSFKGKNNNSHSPVKNGPKNKNIPSQQSREVLVITLPSEHSHEQIGMTPESKVLECHYSNIASCHTLAVDMLEHNVVPNNRSMESLDLPQPDSNIAAGVKHVNATTAEVSNSHTGQEKRTRFSLSHDEGSIGNTSDNLEAVSEAASNHSVTSSLEMETEDQNDNLSDMVSANVSGRGSPNISGRDTPSSQVTEGDIGVSNPQPVRQSHIVNNSAIISKQAKLLKRTRHDIEDKFCKFEIKKLIEGDETISIMSDTWSTDVLASDSETIGESIYDKNFINPNLLLNQQNLISGTVGQLFLPLAPPQPDVSETASESAWSTDELISESDRITEVDIDDANIRLENNSSQYEKGKKILTPIAVHYNQNQIDISANNPSILQTITNIPSSYSNLQACSSNNLLNKNSINKSENHVGPTNENQNSNFCKIDSIFNSGILNDCLNESSKFSISEGDSPNPLINENGVSPLLQTSNKATSQWLNDPCQKFPVQHFDTFNYDSNNFASCSTAHAPKNNISEMCKTLEGTTLCNGENTFKPIKVKKNESQNHGNRNITNANDYERKTNLKKNRNSSENSRFSTNACDDNNFMHILGDNNKSESHMSLSNRNELDCSNINNFQFDPLLQFDTDTTKLNIDIGFSNKHKNTSNENSLLLENYSNVHNDSCFNDILHDKECETLTPVNNIDISTIEKDSIQNAIFESFPHQSDASPNSHISINNNGSEIKFTRGSSSIDGSNTLPRQSTLFSSINKPGTSTGAIPKSISFDSTAEKSHRYSGRRLIDDSSEAISLNFGDLKNNMKKSGGNFLNKLKLFRPKSKGHTAPISSYGKSKINIDCGELLRTINDSGSHDDIPKINANSELSDDILAKYRRKASSGSDAAASDSTSNSGSTRGRNQGNVPSSDDPVNSLDGDSAPDRYSDIEFDNLQKEIQHALSHIDIYNVELASSLKGSTALECALRLVSIVDSRATSALEGFITLDPTRKPLILNALMGNSAARLPYLHYLSNCRKSLLSTIGGLESEYTWHINEIQRQSALAAASRTRSSLAARELRLADLQERLRSGLVDERRDALFLALDNLTSEITAEEAWADATEWDLEQVLITIERVVMSRVYTQTMFPNGEGDIMRDQLLRNHIAKLGDDSSGLSPRLRGTQWVYAQRILDGLCHCKTPRDKVDCVVKCVNNIMSLLSMTSSGIPGADDLTPVLVHVIIKSNPSSLLSTIQFVDNFINPQLEGEQLYCWTQFCAAIEHIKTID